MLSGSGVSRFSEIIYVSRSLAGSCSLVEIKMVDCDRSLCFIVSITLIRISKLKENENEKSHFIHARIT